MTIYKPTYSDSHALVIGINDYENAAPLQFARSDAEAVADKLVGQFGFPEANVVRLCDADATRDAILESYLALTRDATGPDDRVLVFCAGHGHTITGGRGEVGYLVPHDGSDDRLASLIRWDEFTRNAELITAKHVFFIMDACYGGLASLRGLQPGSTRLLTDMLTRTVRQILASGKADQQVKDAGGPIPEHSVFTDHLLQGLDGGASVADGIITANGLMSYVYQRVGTDYDSQQTPHYGFLDGDGDFIFSPLPDVSEPGTTGGEAVFVEVPSVVEPPPSEADDVVVQVKAWLPDPSKAIALDDLLVGETRRVLGLIGEDRLSVHDQDMSADAVSERLRHYERSTRALRCSLAAIGQWGNAPSHRALAQKVLMRLIESVVSQGIVGWIALQYYPSLLGFYSLGMAAIAAENYELLYPIIHKELGSSDTLRPGGKYITALGEGVLQINRADVFKTLPEHKRHRVPRSEYTFKLLQPELDDLLFLGHAYESVFDRLEVFFALTYADLSVRDWAPIGRFAWKYVSGDGKHDPFRQIVAEAAAQADRWPPIAAGFFGGSASRFKKVADNFEAHSLARLEWF